MNMVRILKRWCPSGKASVDAGILYAFSVVNLLFMHYYIVMENRTEAPLTFVDNLGNIGHDCTQQLL